MPEVSIFSNNNPQFNNFLPHNFDPVIKHSFPIQNKENVPTGTNSSQILKKQVRFESPRNSIEPQTFETAIRKPLGNNFEQIYLANVPNRHLDLSTIELPVKKVQETQNEPKTYKDYKQIQQTRREQSPEMVTDIFNYKSTPTRPAEPIFSRKQPEFDIEPRKSSFEPIFPKKREIATQTDPQPEKNDPTVVELLKIISQQNEQLLMLQQQVTTLINKEKQLVPTNSQSFQPFLPPKPQPPLEKPKNPIFSKFSIDLMTSFEVAVRRQQQNAPNRCYEPRIQDISEEQTVNSDQPTPIEPSMHFHEPIKVVEQCVSPEPSIKINMNDYDSSDEENRSEMEENIYENIMSQVNKILKKTQSNSSRMGESNETMLRVKEATMRQLKRIGVSLPEEEVCAPNDTTGDISANEVSFAVKQLLMKYLPARHLAKFASDEQKSSSNGLIQARPDFSFATVQYMKKYNLLQGGQSNPKILDISKLKNQPKLLWNWIFVHF